MVDRQATRTRSAAAWIAVLFLATFMVSSCTVIPAQESAAQESAAQETVVADAPANVEQVASESTPDKPIPLQIGVGYVPNVQFAPIYVGIVKGMYAAEGLAVELAYGFENDYLKLVGTDELQFMVGSGDQVILGRGQGLPVRYVLNWYTRFPVVVFAKAETGIREPSDLAGKQIGIPGPFGASYVAYLAILRAGGLSEADVTTESIGFTQAAALSAGTVEAAVDYAVNGPIVLGAEGIETTEIALDDYLRLPANGLVTNEKTIAQNPELVGKVARATARAIRYTLDHPDEAFDIALAFVPEASGENRSINRAVFDASLAYWRPQPGYRLGETKLADWADAVEFMHTIGLVSMPVEAEEMYTNEFVPQDE